MPNPDGGGNPGAEVAARIVAAAELTAARLVAQGESELMLARADAARIQAAARVQLAQAMARDQAFPGGESPPADDDAAFQLTEEARRQAAEIVADARKDARRILEEAQRLLESLRRQEGSPRADSQDETEAPPEPPASPSRPPVEPDVVVDDRDAGSRASQYPRQPADLPSLGDTDWRG